MRILCRVIKQDQVTGDEVSSINFAVLTTGSSKDHPRWPSFFFDLLPSAFLTQPPVLIHHYHLQLCFTLIISSWMFKLGVFPGLSDYMDHSLMDPWVSWMLCLSNQAEAAGLPGIERSALDRSLMARARLPTSIGKSVRFT